MDKKIITSLQNPRIKRARKLRERRERKKSHLFLIEGFRELLRAQGAGKEIKELFVCPKFFLGSNEETLIDNFEKRGTEIWHCTPSVFEKISYRDRPDGLLAIAEQSSPSLSNIKLSKNPLIVVAEAVEKPGNLGTIIRSADAVGADLLIVSDPCTDIHNPNVIRASVGTFFTVPIVEASNQETFDFLKKHQVSIVATTPNATKEYTQVDLSGPVAILMGTEQLGLSSFWLEKANLSVRIPMLGVADSLNVSSATTLLLYEALRQRRG